MMKEQFIDIVKMLISAGILPFLVSIGCFKIQYKKTFRDEERNKFPKMFTLELSGKDKMQINKSKIELCSEIIEFRYRSYEQIDNEISSQIRKTIEYKRITYEKLVKKLEKESMFLMGFENLTEDSCCLNYIIDDQGHYNEIDKLKVQAFISKAGSYCFVCMNQDIPLAVQGTFLESPISYEIKGRKDDVIVPKIRIQKH